MRRFKKFIGKGIDIDPNDRRICPTNTASIRVLHRAENENTRLFNLKNGVDSKTYEEWAAKTTYRSSMACLHFELLGAWRDRASR